MVLDKAMATELSLCIENDGTLYRQMARPIIENYARKKVKGTYTKTLALKGILNLVEAGRRRYIRQYGSLGPVSMDTKKEVAKQLYDWINEESSYEAKNIKRKMMISKKLKTLKKKS